MKSKQKRTLLAILTFVLLAASAVLNVKAQPAPPEVEGPLKTLSGSIRWKKALGVLPKSPGSTQATDNICAHFYVVVTRSPFQSSKPIQYDIALEDKPELSKPDYYSCRFEMQVPSNVNLAVYPGMGDGLAWRWDAPKSRYHYYDAWIDVAAGRAVRSRGIRGFQPENRVVVVGNKGLNIPFELLYENGAAEQAEPLAKDSFVVASRPVFSPSYALTGSAVLQWDAGAGHPNAELWVQYNNSRERVLFVKQPKGAQQVQVQRGLVYTYVLMDGRNVLATTTVVGQ